MVGGLNMSTPEKNFENRLKRWLESEGIYRLGTSSDKMKVPPCGYYEKRWGNAITGSGKPDMLIVVKGKMLEAELKAENGTPSPTQLVILDQIKNSGCKGVVVYPSTFEVFKNLIWEMKK